ncbi:HET-domain-containing protein [Polyplosphaeria fusca]|uniref:HET-domain-containing protein n=1 Tax=Polyplosphaeria fusca TaxID=682080 RepID=A0A9P4R5J8_9PLEO|nr:HET-domain-containing protein [Polyplosphaeria fusca]
MDGHSCEHCRDLVLRLIDFDIDASRNVYVATVQLLLEDAVRRLAEDCLFMDTIRCDMDTTKDNLVVEIVWKYIVEPFGMTVLDSIQLQDPNTGVSLGSPLLPFVDPFVLTSLPISEKWQGVDWIPTVPMNRFPDSPESFELMRSWLSACLESHCSKTGQHSSFTSYAPSRLLHLSQTEGAINISIVQLGADQYRPYVTLSYCWGGDQLCKTTRMNLQKRYDCLSFQDLPKTIQDAVRVTLELGYDLLWVDSLCIIQDNEEDKTREIAQMPFIYSKSVLTLAATSAAAANDGFLNDRFVTHSKQVAPHAANAAINTRTWGLTEPLSTRGWCFQEYALSSHILEFGSRQTRWICQHSEIAEDHHNQQLFTDGWTPYPESPVLSFDWKSSRWDLSRTWNTLVHEYTKRSLTFPSDRPLAISALAHEIGTTRNEEYVAGHWLSTLPSSLLWRVRPDQMTSRLQPPRSPSWSWLSIDGAMQQHNGNYESYIELVDHRFTLQEETARYGSVQEAVLTIRGRVKNVSLRGNTHERNRMPAYAPVRLGALLNLEFYGDTDGYFYDLPFFPDADNDDGHNTVHLLEAASEVIPGSSKAWALVLKENQCSGGNRRFSRIGVTFYEKLFLGMYEESYAQQWDRLFDNVKTEVLELV